MKVEDNKVVTLHYELREDGKYGELMEVMSEKYPFEFLFGNGNLLPTFEANIKGLTAGSKFEFVIEIDQAYGQPSEDNIINIPRSAFTIDGEIPGDLLQINQQVSVTDDQGDQHTGRILEFDDDFVRMDFNHFMAGKNLYFSGAIIHVREATIDEIIRKHHLPSH